MIREGGEGRVEREPGGEAAEGSRARRRRSESVLPPATPPATTWGAAEMADPRRGGANPGRRARRRRARALSPPAARAGLPRAVVFLAHTLTS